MSISSVVNPLIQLEKREDQLIQETKDLTARIARLFQEETKDVAEIVFLAKQIPNPGMRKDVVARLVKNKNVNAARAVAESIEQPDMQLAAFQMIPSRRDVV